MRHLIAWFLYILLYPVGIVVTSIEAAIMILMLLYGFTTDVDNVVKYYEQGGCIGNLIMKIYGG